jgi:hypothetical protein
MAPAIICFVQIPAEGKPLSQRFGPRNVAASRDLQLNAMETLDSEAYGYLRGSVEMEKLYLSLRVNTGNSKPVCLRMTERDNLTDPQKSKEYRQTMTDRANELETLRTELQNLLVRFGLRALKLYQTGTPEPLQSQQMSYLIKYELTNAIADVQDPKALEAIINQTKEEWKKLQETK